MMDALTALRLIALNDFRAHSVLELTAGLYMHVKAQCNTMLWNHLAPADWEFLPEKVFY